MRRILYSLMACIALTAAAHAWTVTVISSQGLLNPGSVVTNVPFVAISNPLPQVTFLTAAGVPNPIWVGGGTSFNSGSYLARYTITANPGPADQLTGFNFLIAGFVQGDAEINWNKVVVDDDSGDILYNGSGTIAGAGRGGTDGAFSLSFFVPLSRPASNIQVVEDFTLFIGGDAPSVNTAALMLVEQDWVPEPASLLALGAGLAGLMGLRRRTR